MRSAHAWYMYSPAALAVVFAILVLVAPHIETSRRATQLRALPENQAGATLQAFINEEGSETAWEFLKSAYMGKNALLPGGSDPHVLAHSVGKALYYEKGIDGIASCDHTFSDGCFHGVIETVALEEGPGSFAKIGDACLTLEDAKSCAHGAGHGITLATQSDLLEALQYCDMFPAELSHDCADGAIMSNAGSWKIRAQEIEKQPWAICETVPVKYEIECASGVGDYFANESEKKYSAAEMAAFCAAAPSPDMAERCLLRINQRIVKDAGGDAVAIKGKCNSMTSDQRDLCLKDAMGFALSERYIDANTSDIELCKAFFDDAVESCLRIVPPRDQSGIVIKKAP